jgi:hypothetical protein
LTRNTKYNCNKSTDTSKERTQSRLLLIPVFHAAITMAAELSPARIITKKKSVYLRDSSNFLYVRISQTGLTTYWRCREMKKSNCPARAQTVRKNEDDPTEYLKHSDSENHSHLSSVMDVRHLEEMSKALEKAVENKELKPRSLFGDITKNLDQEGLMVRTSELGVIRSIQRARRKSHGDRPLPATFTQAITLLPEDLYNTASGDPFCLFAGPVNEAGEDAEEADEDGEEQQARGQEDPPTMILYLSAFGKEVLTTSAMWFSDGTFSTAPTPFQQLYVVFAELASGKCLPCFYALLPNKKMSTYKKMWTVLSEGLGPDIALETAMLDMESGASTSLTAVFGPGVTIAICYFHLRKTWRENLGKKGVLAECNSSPVLQHLYITMVCCAFVPPKEMVKVWESVVAKEFDEVQEDVSENAVDYFTYFESTFIGRQVRGRRKLPLIKPDKWSQYDAVMTGRKRTNNVAEGWNNAWTQGSQIHANLWTVIEKLVKEDSMAQAKWREQMSSIQQAPDTGDEGNKRRTHQKNHDKRLLNVCQQFYNITDKVNYFNLLRAVL